MHSTVVDGGLVRSNMIESLADALAEGTTTILIEYRVDVDCVMVSLRVYVKSPTVNVASAVFHAAST